MNVLKLAAVGMAVAGLTACGGPAAPAAVAPQPTVTVSVTPTPTRIVTLEDIIQGCADAMAKAKQIELYDTRPKACAQLGEPEFQRASAIAIPLITAQYDTPAP